MKNDTTMRIEEIRIHNIMRLETVAVRPDRPITPIAGKNGAGKTTFINCIKMLLAGADAIPDEPIREGEHVAVISGVLKGRNGEEYRVELNIDRSGPEGAIRTQLYMRDANGDRVKKPQHVLDALYGQFAGDPFEFIDRMTEKQQEAVLMKLAGLDFSKEVDPQRARIFEQRTVVNREVSRLETEEKAARREWSPDLPKAEVSAAELADKLAEMRDARDMVKRARERAEWQRAEVQRLRTKLAEVENELRAEQAIADVPAPSDEDCGKVAAAIRVCEETNREIRDHAAWSKLCDSLHAASEKSEKLTRTIETIDDRKRDMLAKAKLPVPGLTFGDGAVRLNGHPLAQASRAEQIRLGVAVMLSGGHRLRVLGIRDGSLLDDESRALLAEIIEEFDAQAFIEVIQPEEGGILLEDGRCSPLPPTAKKGKH